MMYFINFHYGSVSIRARRPAQILFGNGDAANPVLREVQLFELASAVKAKHVLFVTHGFNVSYAEGARSLARLAANLQLGANVLVIGVLWPGDFFIPAINYPEAAVPAIEAGQTLGDLCNASLNGAASVSFVSHSLGARVVLEAVERLNGRKARMLCLAAGAVNDDCLTVEYAAAPAKTLATYTLASVNDRVLQLAFPIGDLIGEILVDDHSPFHEALGRHGPRPAAPPPADPIQIPDSQDYGHHNYLPPSTSTYSPPAAPPPLTDCNKWLQVRDFIERAFDDSAGPGQFL